MWKPTASLSALQQRANIIKKIRCFFEKRNVLEVETPLLYHSTATDPHLESFKTTLHSSGPCLSKSVYLQTSPEFPMKRMLAAGYGSIYQMGKVFRNNECGSKHNPEFTMLEWYRVGMTYHSLMDEIDELLDLILKTKPADRISYRKLFESYVGINPHTATHTVLKKLAIQHGIDLQSDQEETKSLWLDLLLTHLIEPELGSQKPIFIYDYPADQAALAKIRMEENYAVGERFELYYQGMELANGYQELSHPQEQRIRFEQDNAIRKSKNLEIIPIDELLLQALASLPFCAGVALGVDRLICIALGKKHIADVLSFNYTNV